MSLWLTLVGGVIATAGTGVAQTRGSKDGDASFPFASIFVEYAKTIDKDLDIITLKRSSVGSCMPKSTKLVAATK